jgi:hypothetical protein
MAAMDVSFRWAAMVAFAGLSVVLCLSGCDSHATTAATFPAVHPLSYSDDTDVSQQITSVHLDTDSGNVRIDSRPGTAQVSVHRDLDNESNRQVDGTTQIANGVLTLNGCEPRCVVNYTLVVPPGVKVDGATTEGAVRLNAINGIDVTTDNGSVDIQDVTAGPLSVHTNNGRVTATGLAGSGVQVQGVNGDVELETVTPQDITAQLANGSLTLDVPRQAYQVSHTTLHGEVSIDVPNDPGARNHLRLTTENGAIAVRSH